MTEQAPADARIDIEVAPLRGLLERAFGAAGVVEEEARLVVDALIEAELREVPTHGVLRVAGYLNGLRSGRFNPEPSLRVLHERPTAVLLDGDNGLGYLPTWRAMERAVAIAGQYGFGAAGVRNSNEFGRAAYYAEAIAARGYVGIVCGNTRPLLGPPDARAITHGNNPIAFATPGADAPSFDASLTPRSGGELLRRRMLGLPLAPEWGYRDSEGNPTTDPAAAMAGVAPAAGGAKGFGFALLVDLLAGALTGASSGPGVPLDNSSIGAFVLALDPDLFGAGAELEPAMQRGAAAVREAGGRWPGDRARAARLVNAARERVSVSVAIAEAARQAIVATDPGLAARADLLRA